MSVAVEMRTSERSALKKCAQQWYWSQVEGLVPRHTANALWFGSAVHEALAAWYLPGGARGPHPAETFLKALEGERSIPLSTDEDQVKYVDARALGIAILNHYVDVYGQDSNWDVLATEETASVLLPQRARKVFGLALPRVRGAIRYHMTFDGAYRDRTTGEVWLMEHKTAASIRVDHLPLDDQAGSYWAFATTILRKRGLIGPDEEIAGIMYNFLRKAELDDRPKTALGYHNKPQKQHYVEVLLAAGVEPTVGGKPLEKLVMTDLEALATATNTVVYGDVSKQQPAPYFERFPVYRSRGERALMLSRIQDEAFYAAAYRNGELPITKAPDRDRCSWCPFQQMCILDESGDAEAVRVFKETQFKTRDAYDVYRKAA